MVITECTMIALKDKACLQESLVLAAVASPIAGFALPHLQMASHGQLGLALALANCTQTAMSH